MAFDYFGSSNSIIKKAANKPEISAFADQLYFVMPLGWISQIQH
jgi:hypothetical protein